ncbi:ectonucleotide pyrophosphatase/phosphodiesterase family member 5-like isoform X2 [Contarinia nasturtii]|uniref:ectonucleotide pyrophosphatase/phosphodiesterase family member 5-like isoform X2 n=1 Tax=Contarinia nasturtii TaxID=265458 RepID=UPI0012D44453|nr:ectonucleotide pyrophosphatase/phosphodiesterase family member 5-like isoform X2 [Contarinia nasturtii]
MAFSSGIFIHSIVLILLCHRWADGLKSNDRKLIVVSFDAFKPIYLEEKITTFFKTFYKDGIRAIHMKNSFPTKTFVNHFSIATGLYPQNHGVTGNEVYDLEKNQFYKYSYELFHYNESVIPIWRLNEDQGGRTGVMMWPGGDFAYQGKKCNFTKSLDKNMKEEDRIDVIMKWFKEGANFVMFYIEQPDEEGHAYSPDSTQELNMVKKLDAIVVYLEQSLIINGLDDNTDIIILSDHVLQVVCADGKYEEACNNLTIASRSEHMAGKFNAFINEQLLERWHVKNTKRFGPCTVVAEPEYAFQDMFEFAEWFHLEKGVPISLNAPYGVHGYDNDVPSMQPIFLAKGPSFNAGITINDEFSNIDLYYLFCKLLQIKCISIDGKDRQDVWQKMLKDVSINEIQK